MKYSGGIFSGHKVILCSPKITVVGHRCTPHGCLPEEPHVEKIINWGPCCNLSDVHAFLGTIGVIRIFIHNFAHRAHALTKLMCKEEPFHFRSDQITAQENLKAALLTSPALYLIDYSSKAPIILTIDTSHIAVSFHLCQCDLDNFKIRYYAHFSSITLNDHEARFSQPKLKCYGLFHAL
ncbi:hypothetical protein EW146_g896 [Bondarzewia mesenterica]|uniref:Reverse transcriptase/retrotransposon-derived protein RNase H-like domain-containing protein n=1 Tax=Bondarzewia mesenterica TaxID=1095465 RepID=A0A4S4M5D0_9AGAM|nr:hypothetical protein EW146_g896 [Bondarzewia mesenterica]